nr:hypothetical protein [Sphingorhabdus profundilacus]
MVLTDIDKVTFYKRDEITTDLICCDVVVRDAVWTSQEEIVGWDMLVSHIEGLPGFRHEWYELVAQPALEASEIEAFSR